MTIEVNLYWIIACGVLSAGIAWGISKAQVKVLAEEVATLRTNYSRDHDLLVEIRTKLTMLLETFQKGCKK